MAQPYLSIIIPAYNEAERLPLALLDIDRRLASAEYAYEIIVVNDGSTDNTGDIVRNLTMVRNLRLIDNKENMGKGGAVRQGMLVARGVIRLFADADNSTSIEQFDAMIPYFSARGGSAFGGKQKYDIVIGSRGVKGAKLLPAQSILRRAAGIVGNFAVQALVLPGIKDTQCGFKAMTAEAAEDIFPRMKISGWGFDVELLSLARRMGYKMKELPIIWANDPTSRVRSVDYLKFLREVATIRIWLWRDKYGIASVESSKDEKYTNINSA